jgi:hypothetical protein
MVYVSLLALLWSAGLLLAIFWIDNVLHDDGRAPLLLIVAGWLAATATVALAEEAADLLPPRTSGAGASRCAPLLVANRAHGAEGQQPNHELGRVAHWIQ